MKLHTILDNQEITQHDQNTSDKDTRPWQHENTYY